MKEGTNGIRYDNIETAKSSNGILDCLLAIFFTARILFGKLNHWHQKERRERQIPKRG